MKFGNPISDVNATITGGEINLAPGTKVDTSGSSNLGVNSLPSSNIPATGSANATPDVYQTPVQLLPNATGTTQYILISCIISNTSSYPTGTSLYPTLFLTGTASDIILQSVPSESNSGGLVQIDLHDLTTPVGAGVACQIANSSSRSLVDFTLFYAEVSANVPYVNGNLVKAGG